MTKKKQQNQNENTRIIGQILQDYRSQLTLKKPSRAFFIADREDKGLVNPGWISEKTLTNLENGYNSPSLITLKQLSIALEVDFVELIKKIEPYI
ncbi:helix-turn-helix domain-containing protein [Lysinibacillus xylanilyticus]|uniref:helix-turn-helix domain-containing protein n=1 Tax=Lysinibacillus xylanilyticus TaxID=582475 RepID=UPI003CFD117A